MGKHEEQNKSMRAGIQNRSYDHHPDIKLVLCGIKRRGRAVGGNFFSGSSVLKVTFRAVCNLVEFAKK